MKSAAEEFRAFIDSIMELDKMIKDVLAGMGRRADSMVESPRQLMPHAPQQPRPCTRTPATAQRYLRQSPRRTQGRKGRLAARVKS